MFEVFNGIFKSNFVCSEYLVDFDTVKECTGKWIEEENTCAPHSALDMMIPNEYFNLKLAAQLVQF
jgi:putative transposase